jgi:hypothetical protein
MANPQRENEQRAEAVFEHCVALDVAANVSDDATVPGVRGAARRAMGTREKPTSRARII